MHKIYRMFIKYKKGMFKILSTFEVVLDWVLRNEVLRVTNVFLVKVYGFLVS